MRFIRDMFAGKATKCWRTMAAVTLGLTCLAGEALAAPLNFYSTTAAEASYWQVATNVGGVDGAFSSFPTTGFTTAVAITNRPDWIANNSTGTNGGMETWTFFVFRQTFDLTGYDAMTAHLAFQWGADDTGEVFASRGSWTPKYRFNGGSLVDGTAGKYALGNTVDLTSGFVAGLNAVEFFVEGNGVTDGFTLKSLGLTVDVADSGNTVPEPSALALLGVALFGLGAARRRKS